MKRLVGVITIFLLLVSCGQREESIKIGVVLPLTGPVAEPGNNCLHGIQLAVDQFNQKNDIKINLLVEDSQSDPKQGVNGINKLITVNNTKVIIGDIMSSVTLAIAPIAEKNNVVLLSPGASNPKLTTAGDYIFRNIASDVYDGKVMANYIINNTEFRDIAIIYVNNDYGVGVANVFAKEFSDHNGKIVLKDYYKEGENNFRTIATKINSVNPDCIYIVGNPTENGLLVKQLYELGNSAQIFGNLSFDNEQFLQAAGNSYDQIIFSAPYFSPTSQDSLAKAFVLNFKKEFSYTPDVAAALGYDAANIITKTLSEVNYDLDSLKNALYTLDDFEGVTGITKFDKNGDASKSILIKSITSKGGVSIRGKYE